MYRLLELRMPEHWRPRTRVFVTAPKVPDGLAPRVSREVYAAERDLPPLPGEPPRPGRWDWGDWLSRER